MPKTGLLSLLLLLCCFTAAGADFRFDLPYGPGPDQTLDLYLPDLKDGPARPLALVIHSGSWAAGDKTDPSASDFCLYLAQHDIVAASINYKLFRFSGTAWQSDILEWGWPGNIQDCQLALNFLLERAQEYGIDPDAVVPVGCSAGGHLALLLAYAQNHSWLPTPSIPFHGMAGVISIYGIHDLKFLVPGYVNLFFRDVRLDSKSATAPPGLTLGELLDQASPASYLDAATPPTFLLQGGKDRSVRPEIAIDLAKKLSALPAPFHLWYLPDAGHDFYLDEEHPELRAAALNFIRHRTFPDEHSADAILGDLTQQARNQ